MSQERLSKIKNVLNARQPDVSVILDTVHKAHNLSAIIRTCDAVGIPEVHAVENQRGDIRTYAGATAGTHKWVSLHRHLDLSEVISSHQAAGQKVVAAHLSDKAIDFREVDYTQPITILMGAEKTGVSGEAAELVDQHITINMHGMVESLNVSVAFALIAFEMERQRKAVGLYDQIGEGEVFDKTVFEWMQPKMARFFRERGMPYPAIDEDGDLLTK